MTKMSVTFKQSQFFISKTLQIQITTY